LKLFFSSYSNGVLRTWKYPKTTFNTILTQVKNHITYHLRPNIENEFVLDTIIALNI